MSNAKRAFCFALLLVFLSVSTAGTVRIEGNSAIVSGLISAEDVAAIDKAGIEKIIFNKSLGGDMKGVYAYIELIKRKRLATQAASQCYSACAIAFLSGNPRTIVEGGRATILLHLARFIKDGIAYPSADNEKILLLIDSLTNGKMRGEARNLIASSWNEASGVGFVIAPGLWGERIATYYCDGTQGFDTSKCKILRDADPYDLGILTNK